jgi:polysaccharide chain length determinant protein (PEP-CTERM system associated)
MNSKQSQQAQNYLNLFLRRKVLIITFLLLSLPVGLGIYLNSPKLYMATSLLSYQQQKVANKMSPDSRLNEIVSTLSQIIISRRNLEETILNLNLYPEARKTQPIENVIEMMRKNIQMKPMKRGNVFTVSFTGSSPESVMKVTNGLASKFIEENLKYRQERAYETSAYTSDELQMAKKGMDKKENAMRDYKLKYYYEMPEQRETNVVRLISLQGQYQDMQENVQELERTLILIQEQMNNRGENIESAFSLDFDFGADEEYTEFADGNSQIVEMKLILAQLLLRYTEKHPEVKRIKKIITKLEKEVSQDNDDSSPPSLSEAEINNVNSQETNVDMGFLQLDTQRENVEINIANIRQGLQLTKKRIEQYEKWVTSTPTREAEWSSLTREYGQLKRHYDHLVSQDLQAKSMLNLERKQKGSQFKIEDPARYPGKPTKPDFLKILGGAVAIGLGLGFGLTLLLDFFDTSFRDGDSVVAYLGLPLIATIPYLDIKKDVKRRKRYAFLSFGFLSCFFLLIVALFFYVWRKGLIVI